MELNITGDFVKQVLEASGKNSGLAEQLAEQLLASVDQHAMATYLLTKEAAVSLLVSRLQSEPAQTIEALQELPGRVDDPVQPAARRGRKKAATRAKSRRPKAQPRKGQRRRRLSTDEVADLKQQVCDFLAKNGWSTRKELTAAVDLSTQAIYRRIMGELQEEGAVVSEGEKATAVYGLK